MDELDKIFLALAEERASTEPTMACLYTALADPPACTPMLRSPTPPVGQVLDATFAQHLTAALTINDAIHDGAVMFGRENIDIPYRVTGWSYRLFPPKLIGECVANRGSAFNSCIAMSSLSNVDRLYLVARSRVYRFEKGMVVQLRS